MKGLSEVVTLINLLLFAWQVLGFADRCWRLLRRLSDSTPSRVRLLCIRIDRTFHRFERRNEQYMNWDGSIKRYTKLSVK